MNPFRAAILATCIAMIACHRPSVSEAEETLSQQFPIGMSFEDASELAQANYSDVKILKDVGSYRQQGAPRVLVGHHSIIFHFAEYRQLFTVSLEAHLAFDENGKLSDIWVERTVDAV